MHITNTAYAAYTNNKSSKNTPLQKPDNLNTTKTSFSGLNNLNLNKDKKLPLLKDVYKRSKLFFKEVNKSTVDYNYTLIEKYTKGNESIQAALIKATSRIENEIITKLLKKPKTRIAGTAKYHLDTINEVKTELDSGKLINKKAREAVENMLFDFVFNKKISADTIRIINEEISKSQMNKKI